LKALRFAPVVAVLGGDVGAGTPILDRGCRCVLLRRRPGDLPRLLAIATNFQFARRCRPPLAYGLPRSPFGSAGFRRLYAVADLRHHGVLVRLRAGQRRGRAVACRAGGFAEWPAISLFTVRRRNSVRRVLAMALLVGRAPAFTGAPSWGAGAGPGTHWAPRPALLLTHHRCGAPAARPALLFHRADGTRARGARRRRTMDRRIGAGGVFCSAICCWLQGAGHALAPTLARFAPMPTWPAANTSAWLRLLAALVLAHAGLAIPGRAGERLAARPRQSGPGHRAAAGRSCRRELVKVFALGAGSAREHHRGAARRSVAARRRGAARRAVGFSRSSSPPATKKRHQ